MVIFHSYVSLPEGISHINPILASTQMVIREELLTEAQSVANGSAVINVTWRERPWQSAMAIRCVMAWVWILHI
jgi:hypothetical protein